MPAIDRSSLMSLEAYSRGRGEFRRRVLAHKKARRLALGPHLTLLFEDELTVRYQVQEMLRIERIFEDGAIEEELATYNPMIPDGSNLKATMLIEYEDAEERRVALAQLIGIEDRVYVAVEGFPRVYAIADEDLDRETEDKTSAVHFLRFEFQAPMIEALLRGAAIAAGVDHPAYAASVPAVPAEMQTALRGDFATVSAGGGARRGSLAR